MAQRAFGIWGGLTFGALVLTGSAIGCSSGNEIVDLTSTSGSSGTQSPSIDTSPEAVAGRSAASGLYGAGNDDGAPDPADPVAKQNADLYDALVEDIVAVAEEQEPGCMARYGTALQSTDAKTRVDAIAAMRIRLDGIAASAALDAKLASDPRFAGKLQPTSIFGGASLSLQDLSGNGVCGPIPNLGKVNGKYGDDCQGTLCAFKDAGGLLTIAHSLREVDNGTYTPDPESRLGAYAATRGYPRGSVGEAVHNAIGTIYVSLGNFGEEKIGRVFNDPVAKSLFNDPVESVSGIRMAEAEQRYWANVAQEDPASPGGNLGAAFSPAARDALQRRVFGNAGVVDGGAGCGPKDSCATKADGLYCSEINTKSAYQCRGTSIVGAQYCDPDAGANAKCTGGSGGTIQCQ